MATKTFPFATHKNAIRLRLQLRRNKDANIQPINRLAEMRRFLFGLVFAISHLNKPLSLSTALALSKLSYQIKSFL